MSAESSYSLLDRLIHRVAFSSRMVQLPAADMELTLYGKTLEGVAVERPIFITSLPRAGTTLLLEVLSRVPGHATHSYRDMPFVLAPLLWARLSRSFRKSAVARERAHGDGMQIGYDSPEAFEEVVWRTFWPEHFRPDRIAPWAPDAERAEFRAFLVDHMRKIIALRGGDASADRRYVSKNNANIARLDLLRRLFPDAVLLLPFRAPLDHAASMRHQHVRFLEVHEREPFSRRYMADIGHFEFGALHRPIDFPGLEEVRARHTPEQLDYWIGYWAVAFEEILRSASDIVLVSYDGLCARGDAGLERLEHELAIGPGRLVTAGAGSLRPPRTYEDRRAEVADAALLARAEKTYEELLRRSAV